MIIEQIDRFLANNVDHPAEPVKISFKTRTAVEGVFIKSNDYSELRRKNFWRVVSVKNLESYKSSKDINFSRIFNGAEFTKLSPNKS